MEMTIEKIITNEKGIAADFQNAINTHMASKGLSVEELCCDDTEVIEEQLARWQIIADYHNAIVTCLEKYQKIQEIVKNTDAMTGSNGYACAFIKIREVVKDGNDD